MRYEPPFERNDAIDSLCMKIAELVGMISPEAEFAKSLRLHRELRIKTIHSSLLIEGNGLNEKSVTAILGGRRTLAAELKLDPFELAHDRLVQTDRKKGAIDVPVFGSIAAGQPIEPKLADDTFPIPAALHEAYPNAFMLRIEGTSMNRVLPEGYYALIDPCDSVDSSGDAYAVAVGNDMATVKHVRVLSNGLELRPDSDDPTHHPIVFDYADPEAHLVRIIGRVVWHCPPVERTANATQARNDVIEACQANAQDPRRPRRQSSVTNPITRCDREFRRTFREQMPATPRKMEYSAR